MSPVVPVIVPAIVAVKRRRIIEAFRVAGAVSAAAAKTPESLNVSRGLMYRRLVQSGVLKEETGGGVWLDEAAQLRWQRRARRLILIAFVAGLGAAGMLMLFR